jgi:hypothetical protein
MHPKKIPRLSGIKKIHIFASYLKQVVEELNLGNIAV